MSEHVHPRLLLIHDGQETLQYLSAGLRDQGYGVDVASSTSDALQKAHLTPYRAFIAGCHTAVDSLDLLSQRTPADQPEPALVALTDSPQAVKVRLANAHTVPPDCTPAHLAQALASLLHDSQETTQTGSASHSVPNLLILVDREDDAHVLQQSLERAYAPETVHCTVVADLATAHATLRTTTFAVIVADLSIEERHDVATVSELKRAAPGSALIVLTGHEEASLTTLAVQLGAQDYLLKNELEPRTLRRSIRYALETVRAEDRLRRVAHFDALTGLANRITFQERLHQVVERAKRERQQFAVIIIDLDRFKSVNDTYGHAGGDHVLQRVADRLKGATRAYDTVARLGGDEFAILLDDPTGRLDPRVAAERIVRSMARPIRLDDTTLVVTASLGISIFPRHGDTAADLLRHADMAMFEVKASGRHGYRVAKSQGSRVGNTPLGDIRRALACQEFFLHYQPQIDLSSGRTVALEALLRWRRADGRLIMPDQFIAALEDTGLIKEAGRWAMHAACRAISNLEYPTDGPPLRVAVNLSAHQLNEGLPAMVEEALALAAVPAERLELEITESALMYDAQTASAALEHLRHLGVRVAIDDFGTGYSSLAYLQRFRVNTLKMDKTFVQALHSADGRIMVAAMIGLAHQLGLEVVAEGVESDSQLAFLKDHGCDTGQGYLFAKPGALRDSARPLSA